jgi:ABC-2 type transport system permease protein
VTLTDAPADARRARATSSTAVYRTTGRRAIVSGAGWGLIFGVYVAAQALGYATSYKTAASRRLLASEFGSNPGISALVGPAHHINTVAGFTTWKCLAVLAVTGAVWGILLGTKLLRGEEDAGRWELLLTGPTTRRGAAVQAVGALASGFATLLVVTSVLVVLIGRSPKVEFGAGAAGYFALASVSGALMFLAVGALASQLASTRRQAAGYAAALLGACYAVRMVADSGLGLGWLLWLTPLGWVEQLRPFTRPDPVALVPIVLFSLAAALASVWLAGRRDVGASLLRDRSSAKARLVLLSGPVGLALRQMRSTLLAWAGGITAYGLVLGSIAKTGGKIFTSSPTLRLFFSRLGVTGAQAYLGFALLIMAMALGFVAVGQVAAARTEESTGRLENLLVRPLGRVPWLHERSVIAVSVLVVGGLLAGLSTWLGAAIEHAGVGFTSMIDAGLNVVPPALVLLGVGILVFGLWPRVAVKVTYAVLLWSLFVELIGGAVSLNHWVLDTSTLHQMAPAPSEPVDWTSAGAMVAIAVAATLVGYHRFARRDLAGE